MWKGTFTTYKVSIFVEYLLLYLYAISNLKKVVFY